MSQDISKDPRILMIEYALNRLKELTKSKSYKMPASKEKTMEAINRMNSVIKEIKYSYIAPMELAEKKQVKELTLMANQFWDAIIKNLELDKDSLSHMELKFLFNILKGFDNRLKLGNGASLDKAIDIIAVKVVSVSKLEGKDKLFLCRVGDGTDIINIITNLDKIKKGAVLPAAVLSPAQFGSEISTAMFCSSEDLVDMHENVGSRVKNLTPEFLKEVNHHIMNLIKSM
jgi:predicted RNA-binding protein with EMAP domain